VSYAVNIDQSAPDSPEYPTNILIGIAPVLTIFGTHAYPARQPADFTIENCTISKRLTDFH